MSGSYASRNAIATALHGAIVRGECNRVKEILQSIENPEERRIIVRGKNHLGKSALDVAVTTEYPFDPNYSSALRRMQDALLRGDFDALGQFEVPKDKKETLVELLLRAGAEITTEYVIHETMHGSYSSRSSVLQRATTEAVNGINQEGWTALQLAVFHDKGYSTLNDLLEAGADPNIGGPASHLPLIIALIKDSSYSTLSDLLSKGANPNTYTQDGQAPLHLAVLIKEPSYSKLDELVSHGANVNARNSSGMTPLHLLLKLTDKDYSNCVDCLLEAPGFDPNIVDGQGMTALHYLAKHGVFREDVDEDGDEDEDFAGFPAQMRQAQRLLAAQMRQQRHQLRLHQEQSRRHMRRMRQRQREIRHFMQYGVALGGAQHNQETEEDQETDGTILSALIRAGSDLNATDSNGRTPLFYAAAAGHLEILVAMLQAGANPNHGTHPLRVAVARGHAEIVDALLQGGSTVDARTPNTCLHLAARDGKDHILTLLLRAGADPNTTNLQFRTPLHFAVEAGTLSSVEALVSAGANASAIDSEGSSPLHCAARVGDPSIWDVLVQGGADVHKQDNWGMTALMRAAAADLELNTLFLFLEQDPTQLNLMN